MENSVTPEALMEKLLKAAQARKEIFQQELTEQEFERFMKAVKRVGMLTVTAAAEDLDLAVMGMAMDYYSRAIRMIADTKLAGEKVVVPE